MGGRQNPRPSRGGGHQGNSRTPKPPLTHFLCIPLINQTSVSQLENSLAEFKSSIPLVSPAGPAAGHVPAAPLVPYGALRPLGTLHFTLGVMSLAAPERLNEALAFLQSLDFASMIQEAELEARSRHAPVQGHVLGRETSPSGPLAIDLVSLHALPRARSATILHASPLDTTGRLYPFCLKLRDKFIEAGFMHRDMTKVKTRSKGTSVSEKGGDSEVSRDEDEDMDGQATPSGEAKTERPRPLLLHATVANTVYLGKRKSPAQQGKRGGGDRGRSVFTFDASELLDQFSGRPHRPQQTTTSQEMTSSKGTKHKEAQSDQDPFVWARDIPIDRICICEMGAKPVPHDEAKGGPILGQAYKVIGTRSLNFNHKDEF